MDQHLTMGSRPVPRCAHWRAENSLSQLSIPPDIYPWLSDSGSLTKALRDISNNTFEVNVLSQELALPFWHEQRKLKRLSHLAAIVRQVELKIFSEPVVYARSIIPLSLVQQGGSGLANLGRTPLGHLLFKDGRMRVSKREFGDASLSSEKVYARRTPYDYLGGQILVSEFFLPSFNKYLC